MQSRVKSVLKRLALMVPPIRELWLERNRLARLGAVGAGPAPLGPVDSRFWHYNASFDAVEVMKRHAAADLSPHPDYLTNFLGVRIDPRFFPSILDGRAGQIEPIPVPANWHADIAEWAAVLRAVEFSGPRFRALELGCGWGCWINNSGAAARRLGKQVKLIGIEGDGQHVAFAHQAMMANGFAPAQYQIIHGVAAPVSGTALFPIVADAGKTWGSEPILNATDAQIKEARRTGSHEVLPAVSLTDLTSGEPVDLLHIDIQGAELEFVRQNREALNRLVRYIVIGTHSREIEGALFGLLLSAGWRLDIERPAIISIQDGHPRIVVDGVQGWRNGAI
jgi:FkbM family methyltransferase